MMNTTTTQISFHIDSTVAEQLSQNAKERGQSLSAYCALMLTEQYTDRILKTLDHKQWLNKFISESNNDPTFVEPQDQSCFAEEIF